MPTPSPSRPRVFASVWGLVALGALAAAVTGAGQPPAPPASPVPGMPVPSSRPAKFPSQLGADLTWKLNNPAPNVVPESKANPSAVPDKLAARVRSIDERASLRAYEGAPPVIPHAIADINVQTCRACHAQGLVAGDKIARMASHTYLINCTQCHVEAASPLLGDDPGTANSFVGRRASGYGGTRAWSGAPPVMPHTLFMRTNCVSCHGQFGYDGWRPDHLSRTNCTQCHAPAAEFEQLSPTFNMPDVPDGTLPAR